MIIIGKTKHTPIRYAKINLAEQIYLEGLERARKIGLIAGQFCPFPKRDYKESNQNGLLIRD